MYVIDLHPEFKSEKELLISEIPILDIKINNIHILISENRIAYNKIIYREMIFLTSDIQTEFLISQNIFSGIRNSNKSQTNTN